MTGHPPPCAPSRRHGAFLKYWRAFLTPLLVLLLVGACADLPATPDGGVPTEETTPIATPDGGVPTEQPLPITTDGSPIYLTVTTSGEGVDTVILLDFDRSMGPGTTFLGGDLEPESNGGVWVSNFYDFDTLSVAPEIQWSPGPGTLLVTVPVSDGPDFTLILFFAF